MHPCRVRITATLQILAEQGASRQNAVGPSVCVHLCYRYNPQSSTQIDLEGLTDFHTLQKDVGGSALYEVSGNEYNGLSIASVAHQTPCD